MTINNNDIIYHEEPQSLNCTNSALPACLEIDRGFVIGGKAHGFESSDHGLPYYLGSAVIRKSGGS